MWRKRKWIIVGLVVALVAIAGGIAGGMVYAQSGSTSTPPANPGKNLADRVAALLNLPQEQVEAAFAQAEKDMQSDAVKAYLDKLVQAGKMSQTDADNYLKWWQSKPQTPQGLNLPPAVGGKGFGFRDGFHVFGGKQVLPIPTPPSTK